MWKELENFSYPVGYEGRDYKGICATSIYEDLAGCISGFVSNGELDNNRMKIIINCIDDIDKILPELANQSKKYFLLLKEICVEILKITKSKKF